MKLRMFRAAVPLALLTCLLFSAEVQALNWKALCLRVVAFGAKKVGRLPSTAPVGSLGPQFWDLELPSVASPLDVDEIATLRIDLGDSTFDDVWELLSGLDYRLATMSDWNQAAVRGRDVPILFQRRHDGNVSLLLRGVRPVDYLSVLDQLSEISESYRQTFGDALSVVIYGRGNLKDPTLLRNYVWLLSTFNSYFAEQFDSELATHEGALAEWLASTDKKMSIAKMEEDLVWLGLDRIISRHGSFIGYSHINGERRARFVLDGRDTDVLIARVGTILSLVFQANNGHLLDM